MEAALAHMVENLNRMGAGGEGLSFDPSREYLYQVCAEHVRECWCLPFAGAPRQGSSLRPGTTTRRPARV